MTLPGTCRPLTQKDEESGLIVVGPETRYDTLTLTIFVGCGDDENKEIIFQISSWLASDVQHLSIDPCIEKTT